MTAYSSSINPIRTLLTLALLIAVLSAGNLQAQISSGGKPISWSQTLRGDLISIEFPSVDVQSLLAEDSLESAKDVPFRFGFPHDTSLSLTNSGTWESLPDGGKLWRLRLYCPGAYSINLIFDYYWLPEGATLFIYNEDRSMVSGAFTSQNNKEYLQFSTAPVQGDVSILEYYEPANVTKAGVISISRVVHAYRNMFDRSAFGTEGFGSSGSCNNNVNCPEGVPWENEIRAAAMITLSGGTRWCSGSLINNVREDLTPYFLTANHCLGSEATWVFIFNYESPSCANVDGPTWMSISGSTLRAKYSTSDFGLLELSAAPPDSYDVYYAGWSNVDTASTQSVGIHHPRGDIKKISFDNDPVTSSSWSGAPNTHWRIGAWDDGTTEPGSSGSPLYNLDHQIIGQLHGGVASCSIIDYDKYGKIARSWEGGGSPTTRLKDWLDPDNTGAATLDGIDPLGVSFTATPQIGDIPLSVDFVGFSTLAVDTWTWSFGDNDSAFVQSPTKIYGSPGIYDVTLQVEAGPETKSRTKSSFIVALADTLAGVDVEGSPGEVVEVIVKATNNTPINVFTVPMEYAGDAVLSYDSASVVGCRTESFETVTLISLDDGFNKRLTYWLQSSVGGTTPDLAPGSGPILKVYFTLESGAQVQDTTIILFDGYTSFQPEFDSPIATYTPKVATAVVSVSGGCCVVMRGNVDGDLLDVIDITDLTYLVGFMFGGGPAPPCLDEANIDGDIGEVIDISDLTHLVSFMFGGGPPPANCP